MDLAMDDFEVSSDATTRKEKAAEGAIVGARTLSRSTVVGIVGAVAFLIGLVGWQAVVNAHPSALELTESAQWGLLVGMFFFFEAFGSGALIVGAVKRSAAAVLVGVAGVAGACVMVLMDLYHPAVAWRLFLAPNITSPMFLDVLFSSLALVFGILLMVGLVKKMNGLVRVMAPASVVVAVLFPLGTGWLCTTLPGQLGWNTFEMASFFLGVGVCAGATMCFFAMDHGRQVLIGFLAALVVVNLAEVGFVAYGNAESLDLLTMREVLFGKLAPLFWTGFVGLSVLPLALSLVKSVDVRIAAGLGVAGVAVAKYLFAIKGNLFPYLSLDGISVQLIDTASGYPVMSYAPAVGEWVACIGAIGFVVAVVAFLWNFAAKKA